MIKTKIIIAGIGGVGGYFGGLLAAHYDGSETVEINFIARGQHLQQIQKNGLKVITGINEFIAKPNIATDNASEIGIANLIIVSTKSYDLEAVIQQLRPCINQDTIILPLLNGVDNKEKIKKMLPNNRVLDGCVYIVSRLKEAGIIENSGNIQALLFGLDNYVDEKLLLFESLFKNAGIDATLSKNISTIIWEKYIFLSPTATATSCFDKSIGEIVSDEESMATITALIEEVKQIAQEKQILIAENIIEKTLNILKSLSFETTTSMHSDYRNKKPHTELETLTHFVITEGEKANLPTPTYKRMYEILKLKHAI